MESDCPENVSNQSENCFIYKLFNADIQAKNKNNLKRKVKIFQTKWCKNDENRIRNGEVQQVLTF